MQCIWSTTNQRVLWGIIKSSSLGGIGRRPPRSLESLQPLLSSLFRPPCYLKSFSTPHHSQFTSALSSVSRPRAHSTTVKMAPEKIPAPQLPLSAPQMSRAACNAIHLSLQNPIGGLEDAYAILNSLRISSFRNDRLRSSEWDPDFSNIKIDFGREVSPRLSSHALLHGLVRIGRAKQASSLALMMLNTGISLRRKTFQAVFFSVLRNTPRNNLLQPTIPLQPFNFLLNKSRLGDLSSMTKNQGTRAALQLLDAARSTYNKRTDGMFGTLLTICLINGEIILASLIFGLLVKDKQLQSYAVRWHEVMTMDVEKSTVTVPHQTRRSHVDEISLLMKRLLNSIDNTLSSNGNGSALSFASALQALAYLAALLDHQQLFSVTTARLIRSLYNCPRVNDEVWGINRDGDLQRVKAYPYFHSILQRLIKTLKTSNQRGSVPRDMDLPSLNALLHYSLRHRLSPASAELILQHMQYRRYPLKPDVVTYNILLRCGTILHQDSVCYKALEALDLKFKPKERGTPGRGNDPRRAEEHKLISKGSSLLPNRPPHQKPTIPPIESHNIPQLNSYTLSSYITYLASTSQHKQIVDLVFEIFPHISAVGNGDQSALSRATLAKIRRRIRAACVKRAVELGPYVLTALLNALFKARKTGLMKRVWRITKAAERKSWQPGFAPGVSPWIIPVHAYTIMCRCCRLEHKNRSMIPASFQQVWSPREHREHLLRVSFDLYRLMKTRAKEAQAAIESGSLPRTVVVQPPDLRLFNVVLSLFVFRRRPRRNREHYRHNFRRAQRQYARRGVVSRHWNPMLQELGEDMINAGYALPPGLRHVFIGHWDQGTWNLKRPLEFDHRPFLYPRNRLPSYTSFNIPVHRIKRFQRRLQRLRSKNLTNVLKT